MNPMGRNITWLLAIIPFAFLLVIIVKFGVPVPYLDAWDFVPLLQKMDAGNLTLSDIWTLHNEHRLLFPQIIMLGLARLTSWDIRFELGTSVLLATAIFLLLSRQVLVTAEKLQMPALRWAIPLIGVVVFSIGQYQNWLWGWQLQIFLSVFGVVAGIVLLGNPPFTWIRFFGAALLGVIASYSFGNGGVFWLVGFLILWITIRPGQERWIRLTVWLFLTGLTMGLYFYHYERLEEHPPLSLLFSHPLEYLVYIFKYLGNICAQYSGRAGFDGGFALLYGFSGVVIMIWAVVMLRRKRPNDLETLIPFFGVSLYSIGSAFVVGIGRLGLGADQAVASRYCTVTAPFWASLVTILWILSIKPKSIPKVRSARAAKGAGTTGTVSWHHGAARLLVGVISLLLVLGSVLALNGVITMSRNQEVGRNRLVTLPIQPTAGVDYSQLGALHPRPKIIVERFPFLKEHRLTVFRDEPSDTGQR